MPVNSMIVAVAVFAVLAVFAAAFVRGDLQARPKQLAERANTKRRAF